MLSYERANAGASRVFARFVRSRTEAKLCAELGATPKLGAMPKRSAGMPPPQAVVLRQASAPDVFSDSPQAQGTQ